jgi:hypothetical protein
VAAPKKTPSLSRNSLIIALVPRLGSIDSTSDFEYRGLALLSTNLWMESAQRSLTEGTQFQIIAKRSRVGPVRSGTKFFQPLILPFG